MMKRFKLLMFTVLAAGLVAGCDPQVGANRMTAPARGPVEATDHVTSVLQGSYQQTFAGSQKDVAAVGREVVKDMRLIVLSQTDRQIVAQFSNQNKLFVTFLPQTDSVTRVDVRVDPTNEQVCLTVLRRISDKL